MRSRRVRVFWTGLLLVVAASAGAAWWTADRWLPHADRWIDKAWRTATRPGPGTLPRETGKAAGSVQARGAQEPATPAAQPRKCVQGNRVIYTDQACPAGSTEMDLQGGAVTSLPR